MTCIYICNIHIFRNSKCNTLSYQKKISGFFLIFSYLATRGKKKKKKSMKIRKTQRNFRQRVFPWPRYTKGNGKKKKKKCEEKKTIGRTIHVYADESNRLRFLLLQSDSCIFFFLTSSRIRVLSKCNERKNESTITNISTEL